jgi:acyl dehydratase
MVLRVDAHVGGEPLFTERTTVLFRGVGCQGEGAAVEDVPDGQEHAADGAPRWEAEVLAGREVPFVYDGCTGIVFPIHTSVSFARLAGLPDLLVQGTWTLAQAVREVVAREADADPSRLREVGCRFTGMVLPGTRIVVQALSAAGDGPLSFRVRDGRGDAAVEGWARVD